MIFEDEQNRINSIICMNIQSESFQSVSGATFWQSNERNTDFFSISIEQLNLQHWLDLLAIQRVGPKYSAGLPRISIRIGFDFTSVIGREIGSSIVPLQLNRNWLRWKQDGWLSIVLIPCFKLQMRCCLIRRSIPQFYSVTLTFLL